MTSPEKVTQLHIVDDEDGPTDLSVLIAMIGYLENDAKEFSAVAAYFLARARSALTETTEVPHVDVNVVRS